MLMTQTATSNVNRPVKHSAAILEAYNAPDIKIDLGAADMSPADYAATIWEFLFSKNDRTPRNSLPVEPVDLSHFNHPGPSRLSATWLGHASLLINIDGYRVMTDPVFEMRVSILGPTRFNGNVPIRADHLPSIDVVVISHDHYDHLNKHSVRQLSSKTRRFVVPRGVGARLAAWGVPREKIIELDWWEEFHFDDNLVLAATPAQHFSGRGLFDRNRTLWASWVLMTPEHRLFFSGDSGYFEGFKHIGYKYGPFDMTFIECGAYGEAWPRVHMFPEQTVRAHLELGGKILHPIHWGTFNLALHPWYEPMERLTAAAVAADVKTATPVVGGTTVADHKLPGQRWWREAMIHRDSKAMSADN